MQSITSWNISISYSHTECKLNGRNGCELFSWLKRNTRVLHWRTRNTELLNCYEEKLGSFMRKMKIVNQIFIFHAGEIAMVPSLQTAIVAKSFQNVGWIREKNYNLTNRSQNTKIWNYRIWINWKNLPNFQFSPKPPLNVEKSYSQWIVESCSNWTRDARLEWVSAICWHNASNNQHLIFWF